LRGGNASAHQPPDHETCLQQSVESKQRRPHRARGELVLARERTCMNAQGWQSECVAKALWKLGSPIHEQTSFHIEVRKRGPKAC
jgi:hypothetical protein